MANGHLRLRRASVRRAQGRTQTVCGSEVGSTLLPMYHPAAPPPPSVAASCTYISAGQFIEPIAAAIPKATPDMPEMLPARAVDWAASPAMPPMQPSARPSALWATARL